MYSKKFLSSYSLFVDGLNAFQNFEGFDDGDIAGKAVCAAYKKATEGLTEIERSSLSHFLEWLVLQPELEKRSRALKIRCEAELDEKIAKEGGHLIDKGHIIHVDEFLKRTGINKTSLAQKNNELKIFKMPSWVHLVWDDDYYPYFFADAKYDLQHLESISQALRKINGVGKYRFFTTPLENFADKTPLDLLLEGGLELVLNEARLFRKSGVGKA